LLTGLSARLWLSCVCFGFLSTPVGFVHLPATGYRFVEELP